MPRYFKYFPTTPYSLSNNYTDIQTVTNLTTGFSFDNNLTENSVLYYEYTIKDGDTPENLSHKIYGTSENHWIIMKMNNIIDVKNDWPLDQESLVECANTKYSAYANTPGQTGYEWARDNTHSYYKVETKTNTFDGSKHIDIIQVDPFAYANISVSSTDYTLPENSVLRIEVSKTAKSYFEYENEQNESKRNLRILKPEYAQIVHNEFIRVMSDVR